MRAGHFRLHNEGTKIEYLPSGHKENLKDPEEQVRAAHYLDLIAKYNYPASRIELEVEMPDRTPERYADIVIYEDDAQRKPYIVVECKRDGISDAEFEQATKQAIANAREVEEFRYKKGDPKWDLKPIDQQDLQRTFQKSQDTLWAGGKRAPTTAFDEFAKLLFVKIRDEKKGRKAGEPYEFQIKTHESPASVWWRMVAADTPSEEKQTIAHDLKVYCGLDTYAMYAIWHHLQEAISEVAVPVRSMYAPIHSSPAFATISLASEKEVE